MKKIFVSILVTVTTIMAVTSCSKSSSSTPAVTAKDTVIVNNMAFTPSSISVAAGTTVVWTNTDMITHTVTSTTGAFDSGNLPAGSTYSFKFSTKGTFPYKCTIHPNMTGTVTVN